MSSYRYIVLGGGIAGVSCAETLAQNDPDSDILIMSASRSLKGIRNYVRVTSKLEQFEVEERTLDFMKQDYPNIRAIQARVDRVDAATKKIYTSDHQQFHFGKLCLATGASPNLIFQHPCVLGIRDTETVEQLRQKLVSAKGVAVIGNGAIALETVHSIKDVDVTWVMKESYMGSTFFDASADGFFRSLAHNAEQLSTGSNTHPPQNTADRTEPRSSGVYGNALGPNWMKLLHQSPKDETIAWNYTRNNVSFESKSWPVKVRAHGPAKLGLLKDGDWHTIDELLKNPDTEDLCNVSAASDKFNLDIELSSGRIIQCDLIVSATGVVPNVSMVPTSTVELPHADGDFIPNTNITAYTDEVGALCVNTKMQVSMSKDIFAAGDCASVRWPPSKLWFQMRLWSQARLQGMYAAECMSNSSDTDDELLVSSYNFELFTHITTFLGMKVVLLGLYNGQGLGESYVQAIKNCVVSNENAKLEGHHEHPQNTESFLSGHGNELIEGGDLASRMLSSGKVKILYRISPSNQRCNFDGEYIKVVLLNGKVVGAILVGETELEETLENLILNGINVEELNIDILNPEVDVEDYFD